MKRWRRRRVCWVDSMVEIVFRIGNDVDLDGVIDLYHATTLGPRRPLKERARVAAMMQNANLVITAWDGDLLVGIARSLTDHSFVTYLSDLAVRQSHQQRGIGRELIRRTRDRIISWAASTSTSGKSRWRSASMGRLRK